MPSVPINSIRKGNTIRHEGSIFEVVNTDHVKPGKGPAYVQAKLRRLPEGGIAEVRFNSSSKVEQLMVTREKYGYSYDAGDHFVFMHSETYEELNIERAELEDRILYLKSGDECELEFVDGKFLKVTLPKDVTHEIVETPPAIKGATATNQLKPAKTETGLDIKVPPFIEVGDRVRIQTETGDYMERAKD